MQGAVERRCAQPRSLALPLGCSWLLMLLTFSPRGREVSSIATLDLIAIAKVVSRGLALALLAYMLSRLWTDPKRPAVMRCLFPFGVFVSWCMLSTFWSPLKAVSLGQSAGLLVLLMLAATLGVLSSGERNISIVLCHLCTALLLISAAVLLVEWAFPAANAFSRRESQILHPNKAGSAASIGITLLVASRLLWGWRWSKVLLVPGVLLHGALLFLAVHRVGAFLALMLVLIMLCALANRPLLAALAVTVSVSGAAYLAIDPGLHLASDAASAATEYVRRGQSPEQMLSLSGRTEMWQVIWESFSKSPLYGHGYFVSSKSGTLDLWYEAKNWTAHNLLLQVLVSTGLVGGVLFLWGLRRPLLLVMHGLAGNETNRRLALFLTLVGIWVFGRSLLNESIVGPITPTSVALFATLGLAVGNLPFSSTDGRAARVCARELPV